MRLPLGLDQDVRLRPEQLLTDGRPVRPPQPSVQVAARRDCRVTTKDSQRREASTALLRASLHVSERRDDQVDAALAVRNQDRKVRTGGSRDDCDGAGYDSSRHFTRHTFIVLLWSMLGRWRG